MKLLHTSDWHLEDTFYGYNREKEFEHFFKWFIDIIQQEVPDTLLINGNIFNNANPSASSKRLLFNFLTQAISFVPKMKIVLTAGNHDSSLDLEALRSTLGCLNIHVRGTVQYDEKNTALLEELIIPIQSNNNCDAVVAAIPFLRTKDLKRGVTTNEGTQLFINQVIQKARKLYDQNAPIVLMANIYAAGATITIEEQKINDIGNYNFVNVNHLGTDVAYAALGLLHKEQCINNQENIRYGGSILPLSFSEKDYGHSVMKIEIVDKRVSINKIEYTPLRRLISIPEIGSTTSDQIIESLSSFSKIRNNADTSDWPYVEIKLNETTANAKNSNLIIHASKERAIHLCRAIRTDANGQRRGDTENISNLGDLRKINPAKIVRALYQKRYNEEIPDEISKLFAEIKRDEESKIKID